VAKNKSTLRQLRSTRSRASSRSVSARRIAKAFKKVLLAYTPQGPAILANRERFSGHHVRMVDTQPKRKRYG
jgi:hypothetical protein